MHDMSTQLIQSPKEFLAFLKRSEGSLKMALPAHLSPDRMMRLALTAFSSNPKLRLCTPRSILSSIMIASQLGLEIGIGGQGWLVPYGKTCTFVPGWQGMVGLLNNTGRATAWTGAVYQGDEFDFQLGSHPRCVHIPGVHNGDPEKMTWAYAVGKVNGSDTPIIEAWPMERVWSHRDRYNKCKIKSDHYSFDQPEMYARKSVLLQVLKYLPRSIELNNAITAANAAELGKPVTVEDGVIIDLDPAEDDLPEAPGEDAQGPSVEMPEDEEEPSDSTPPRDPSTLF